MSAGTGVAITGLSVTIPELAKLLSSIIGREVIDKTGFDGKFALHLEFAMDDALAGLPNPKGIDASPSQPDADSKP